MTNHSGRYFGAILAVVLAGWIMQGCASDGTPTARGQRVIDVLCAGDALVQPVVVPVIVMASPAAGPVAPAVVAAVAIDTALIHPAVVRACAEYMSKPAEVVAAPPAGALVATPVVVTAPAAKP